MPIMWSDYLEVACPVCATATLEAETLTLERRALVEGPVGLVEGRVTTPAQRSTRYVCPRCGVEYGSLEQVATARRMWQASSRAEVRL